MDAELHHLETQETALGTFVYQLFREFEGANPGIAVNVVTPEGSLTFHTKLSSYDENGVSELLNTDNSLPSAESNCKLCSEPKQEQVHYSVLPCKSYTVEYFEEPSNPEFSRDNYYVFSEISICTDCIQSMQSTVDQWLSNNEEFILATLI